MPVQRRLLAVLVLTAALAALVVATPAGAGGDTTRCTAYAVLTPGNEVRPPDTTDPVESRAAGAALVHVSGTTLSFSVAIFNPARETFVAGHIHTGAAGVNGPVLVTLFGGASDRKLFFQAARIDITAEQAAQICSDLGGHYVNYHTSQDPLGAVRGQLTEG
ncbi:MAG TPA: CHRD domain-containing protein [Gaiellaceae bacterium]|nr:CHRD domain-containing protein [Gaiellaceae bacterium]